MLQEIEFTGERAAAIVNESRFLVYSHPVLTMCLCMTPEKFEGKYRRLPFFTDEGFGQRFLYLQAGVPMRGKSDADPDPAVLQAWSDCVRQLAELEIPLSEDEKPQPHVLCFDAQSEQLLTELSKRIAEKMNSCRDKMLSFLTSWITRILNNVIRIAGLLHAVRHGADFAGHDICLEDTQNAARIMRFYCSQAETIICGTTENEIERVQRTIKKYLDKKPKGFSFTLRVLQQNLPKSIQSDKQQTRAEKIRLSFEALIKDGYPLCERRDDGQRVFETSS